LRLTFLIFALTTWIASIVIYPMAHYYCVYRWLFLVLAGLSLSFRLDGAWKKSLAMLLAIFLAIGTMTWELGYTARTPNLSLVRTLQTIKISKPATILQAHGSFSAYLSEDIHGVLLPEQRFSLETFLKNNVIDIIVMHEPTYRSLSLSDKPRLEDLLAQPSRVGYRKIRIPGSMNYLLVSDKRKDIVL
jgi:hypothetical protein